MEITLHGRVPSKKNSKMIVCRGGRAMLLPSKEHQSWHIIASAELRQATKGLKIPQGSKFSITMTLYAPDARKADLSNKFESIADLLVDNGIIEDDNWFVMGYVNLVFGGVDKINPRAEIKIEII